jgi:hypothetical protein
MSENNVNRPDFDELVVGELSSEEIQKLSTLRTSANSVIRELGEMEIRRAKMLGAFQSYEDQANIVLASVKDRVGITEGQAWQVSPDNKVRLIPSDSPLEETIENFNDSGVESTNG